MADPKRSESANGDRRVCEGGGAGRKRERIRELWRDDDGGGSGDSGGACNGTTMMPFTISRRRRRGPLLQRLRRFNNSSDRTALQAAPKLLHIDPSHAKITETPQCSWILNSFYAVDFTREFHKRRCADFPIIASALNQKVS